MRLDTGVVVYNSCTARDWQRWPLQENFSTLSNFLGKHFSALFFLFSIKVCPFQGYASRPSLLLLFTRYVF